MKKSSIRTLTLLLLVIAVIGLMLLGCGLGKSETYTVTKLGENTYTYLAGYIYQHGDKVVWPDGTVRYWDSTAGDPNRGQGSTDGHFVTTPPKPLPTATPPVVGDGPSTAAPTATPAATVPQPTPQSPWDVLKKFTITFPDGATFDMLSEENRIGLEVTLDADQLSFDYEIETISGDYKVTLSTQELKYGSTEVFLISDGTGDTSGSFPIVVLKPQTLALKEFYATFPDNSVVDMKDKDARKKICVGDSAGYVKVKAVPRDSSCTVTGDVGTINLGYGINSLTVKVTAPNGEYAVFNFAIQRGELAIPVPTVRPTVPPSTDATLSSLTATVNYGGADHPIDLHPAFDPAVTSYVLYESEISDFRSVTLSATQNHGYARIDGGATATLRKSAEDGSWSPAEYTFTVVPDAGSAHAKSYKVTIKEVYSILYSINIPEVSEYEERIKVKGTDIELLDANTFERSGYILTGWATNADGTGDVYAPGSVYARDERLRLYAVWEAAVPLT